MKVDSQITGTVFDAVQNLKHISIIVQWRSVTFGDLGTSLIWRPLHFRKIPTSKTKKTIGMRLGAPQLWENPPTSIKGRWHAIGGPLFFGGPGQSANCPPPPQPHVMPLLLSFISYISSCQHDHHCRGCDENSDLI